MIITETLGRSIFSPPSLEKKGVSVKKRQISEINAENIFASPDNISLTTFGRQINGILITRETLSLPEMSLARQAEIKATIRERCRELGINERQLSAIGKRFIVLVAERNSIMNNHR